MFSKVIDSVTLAGRYADSAFPTINGARNGDDQSFIATLRALLKDRIGDGKINVRYNKFDYSASTMRNAGLRSLVSAGIGDLNHDHILVASVNQTRSEDREVAFELFDDPNYGFLKTYKGYVEMTNIREFVAPQMEARFYTNVESRTTVILVGRMDIRKWHYIQSFTPRYISWFFKDQPITDEEKGLLASLTRRSAEDYESRIEAFAEKLDLRQFAVKSIFGQLSARMTQQRVENMGYRVDDLRGQVQNLLNEYSRIIRELDEANMRYAGAKALANEHKDDSELVDYVLANKSVEPLASDGSDVEFIVKTYLDSFDPDMYDSMARREGSHIYHGYEIGQTCFRDRKDRKKLLDAIFSDDPTIRVKTCGYYYLDIRGTVDSRRNFRFGSKYADRIPNPHLDYFDCLGDYSRYINERLVEGDVVGAIEQCVASCKSVNVGEQPTMTRFLEVLFRTNNKVLELADGTSVSPAEALEWLKSKEE